MSSLDFSLSLHSLRGRRTMLFMGCLWGIFSVATAFVIGGGSTNRRRLQQAVLGYQDLSSFSSSVVVRAIVGTNDENDEDVPSYEKENAVDMSDVGFVLLAGGKGSRMKASLPKQFLELRGVPILHHSLDLFLERLPAYLSSGRDEAAVTASTAPRFVVLVMHPAYRPEYQPIADRYPDRLFFADPGQERQGSVENGLNRLVEVSGGSCLYAAVHDSARPLVTESEVCDVVRDAKECGTAAVLGVPCKATIKESDDGGATVLRTLDRSRLWEVHTPQVVHVPTLLEGFGRVAQEGLQVTDDVSVVEAIGKTVRLTRGEYTNLKITTPEDMDVAEAILEERGTDIANMLTPRHSSPAPVKA